MEKIEETTNQRIRRLRKQAGFTVSALANLSEISSQMIKDIEAGRRDAGAKSLAAFAKVFNVTIEDLLANPGAEASLKAPTNLSPKKVMRMYLNVPESIVELAQDFPENHDVWKKIKQFLETEKDLMNEEKASKKKA